MDLNLYGVHFYGEEYYGAGSDDPLLWRCQVDWDRDGAYDRNESPWMVDVYTRRGREYQVRTQSVEGFRTEGIGFEMVRVGEARIVLDNADGRYDVRNTASELYPNIAPARKIELSVYQGGVEYPVFAGKIADAYPVVQNGRKYFVISAVDGLRELGEKSVTVSLQTTRRIDLAVGDVLDAGGWEWGQDLDSTPDYLPYWWVDSKPARSVIMSLADAALGLFFAAANGDAKFYNRYRLGTPTITLDETELGKEIGLKLPWEVIYNRVSLISHPRSVQSTTELWRLYDTPAIAPGEEIEIWANFTYDGTAVPVQSVIAPPGGTDYTANSASDGSGTDLTSSISTSVTLFSESAKIRIWNIGSQLAYLTLMKLRGVPVAALAEVKTVSEDTSSQALYGARDLKLDSEWLQDTNRAVEYASFLKTQFSTPVEYPEVSMIYNPEKQFGLDLFDLVTLNAPSKNINSEVFQVGFIEHAWQRDHGQEVLTKFKLEKPSSLATQWIFPTELGVSSYFSF